MRSSLSPHLKSMVQQQVDKNLEKAAQHLLEEVLMEFEEYVVRSSPDTLVNFIMLILVMLALKRKMAKVNVGQRRD